MIVKSFCEIQETILRDSIQHFINVTKQEILKEYQQEFEIVYLCCYSAPNTSTEYPIHGKGTFNHRNSHCAILIYKAV